MRILLLLILITIVLVLIHCKNRIINIFLTIIKSLFIAITLIVFVRIYIADIYVVPTGSMKNTIMMGDYVLVVKGRANKEKAVNNICVFNSMDEYSKIKYVKRCVAGPGDTVWIKNNDVYVNGKIRPVYDTYKWFFDYKKVNIGIDTIREKLKRKVKIRKSETGIQEIQLTYKEAKELHCDMSARMYENIKNKRKDNMPPVYLPKAGDIIRITKNNAGDFSKIIEYEEPDKNIYYEDSIIYDNNKQLEEYTFKHDYYFMMGDDRHFSYDSRFYGSVADDKFIGYVVKIIRKKLF